MEDKAERRLRRRIYVIALLLAFFLALFGGILYQNQIVMGSSYREASQRRVAKQETVPAARGIVTDSRGQVLIGNRQTRVIAGAMVTPRGYRDV